jgi:hypothetical protein
MRQTARRVVATTPGLATASALLVTGALLAASDTKLALPTGFTYLAEFANANVFERWSDASHRGVHSITSGDVGIIRKPIDLQLTATAELEFEWKYVALPALGPETDAAVHDYHSIAVEFDNGQDLTWFWSRELAPGTKFRCPLPNWDQRETHIVLQSGQQGLGEWKSHRRSILADYTEAVGGEKPARIVAVWFIANSYFGKQPGEAYFANVRLRDGDRVVEVFGE